MALVAHPVSEVVAIDVSEVVIFGEGLVRNVLRMLIILLILLS